MTDTSGPYKQEAALLQFHQCGNMELCTKCADLFDEIVKGIKALRGEVAEPRKRVWTGPGELERTGYIDPQALHGEGGL